MRMEEQEKAITTQNEDEGRRASRQRAPLTFLFVVTLFGGLTLCLDRVLSTDGVDFRSAGSIRNKTVSVRASKGNHDDDTLDPNHAEDLAHLLEGMMGTEEDADAESTLSIVCQLSGELGNNIGKFVHAYVLWLKLTRAATQSQSNESTSTMPTFKYRIILRHQLHSKWVRGRDDAQLCFPSSLGRFDFTLGNGPDFDLRRAEQTNLHWMDLFQGVNVGPEHVQGALDNFTRIAIAKQQEDRVNFKVNDADPDDLASSPISLPFLWSETMVGHPQFVEFVDDYYHEIRRLLEFDMSSCCALKPDPDESVFHHRNFVQEMPRVGVRLGFEEMGPNQTARDLFGHLEPGSRVAVLSRFELSKHEEQFIEALVRQGLQVRFIQGQTGVQDFCFLMSAQKELVGPGMSTYFFWAAILGNAKMVRSYWLDTPETRARNGGNYRVDYVWRTPELRERFKFELHQIDRELGRRWLTVDPDDGW